MRKTVAFACLAALVLGVGASFAEDPPAAPKAQKEHEWLQQLVGDWDGEGELITDPSKPATKAKNTQKGRMIGGFWAMTEDTSEFMGTPFTGILTLGYDTEQKKFVGSWIDSMTTYMWRYTGSLDAAGKVLTLDTEGPTETPGKMAKYREVIELKEKDYKVFTSSREIDGKWVTFATFHYRRKK